jgi:hypothetical protein
MANAVYDKAREAFLNGDLDWSSDTIKVVLVDTEVDGYKCAVDITADQYLSDVPMKCVW